MKLDHSLSFSSQSFTSLILFPVLQSDNSVHIRQECAETLSRFELFVLYKFEHGLMAFTFSEKPVM